MIAEPLLLHGEFDGGVIAAFVQCAGARKSAERLAGTVRCRGGETGEEVTFGIPGVGFDQQAGTGFRLGPVPPARGVAAGRTQAVAPVRRRVLSGSGGRRAVHIISIPACARCRQSGSSCRV